MTAAIPTNKEQHIGGYILLNTIGKGSFAEVRLAWHTLPGTDVAVKIVNLRGSSEDLRELHCLKGLNHLNITVIWGVCHPGQTVSLHGVCEQRSLI